MGAAVAGALVSADAITGPPLVTDDAGVLDPGSWEFILAAEADQRDEIDVYSLPFFEANYGLTSSTMFTAALNRVEIDPPGESSKSDIGELTLEYKWQVYAGDNTAISLVPAYTFPVKSSSTDRGIIEDLRVLGLPIVGSYAPGNWEFNAQYAYELTSTGPDAAFYGFSGRYSLTDALTVLGEVYHVDVLGEAVDETNFSVGFDYTFTPGWAVLFSYGGNVDSNLPREAELDAAFFLGLRYVTGN